MKQNMGNTDRIIRILVATILATLFLTHAVTGVLGYILFGIAVIFVITSFLSICPLYSLLGINTCKVPKPKQ